MPARDDQARARIRRLLDELDYVQAGYRGPDRRREPRHTYRRITPLARFLQASGGAHTTQTITRNLSAGGVSLLHRPFVYPGSSLIVSLTTSSGQPVRVTGLVLACRYTSDGYHESSVRFDQRLELDRFLTPAEQSGNEKHLNRVRRRLDGLRIVVIDPRGTVRHHLTATFLALGARVFVVPTLGKALDLMRLAPVDLLFCGHAHDGGDASQIVRLCRDSGYRSPIIAMDWPPSELARARALPDAGVIASIDPNSEDETLDFLAGPDLKPIAIRTAS